MRFRSCQGHSSKLNFVPLRSKSRHGDIEIPNSDACGHIEGRSRINKERDDPDKSIWAINRGDQPVLAKLDSIADVRKT